MVVELDHPDEGPIRSLGIPVKLSGTPGRIRTPAPGLGEHTDELLRATGRTDEEIRALRAEGAVA